MSSAGECCLGSAVSEPGVNAIFSGKRRSLRAVAERVGTTQTLSPGAWESQGRMPLLILPLSFV